VFKKKIKNDDHDDVVERSANDWLCQTFGDHCRTALISGSIDFFLRSPKVDENGVKRDSITHNCNNNNHANINHNAAVLSGSHIVMHHTLVNVIVIHIWMRGVGPVVPERLTVHTQSSSPSPSLSSAVNLRLTMYTCTILCTRRRRPTARVRASSDGGGALMRESSHDLRSSASSPRGDFELCVCACVF
jgi:hypothetical protein